MIPWCPEENFGLRARFENDDMQESQCTVGDVLEKLTDEAAALNVLQRISYTKWLSRLRYDLETSLNFVVW